MGRAFVLLLIFLTCIGSQRIWAQGCAAEAEPNDTPEQAQPIDGCMAGQREAEDPDIFVFTVEPDDTRRLFQLELEGVPGTITIAELFRPQPGNTRPQRLSSVSTPNGGSAVSNPFMLVPGTYLLGVATAGGVGEYTVNIGSVGDLPAENDVEPNDDRQTASPVEGAFDLSGSFGHDGDSQDWLVWMPTALAPQQRWRLSAQMGLTTPLELRLHDSSGSALASVEANEWGEATLYDLELTEETYAIRLNSRVDGAAPYRIAAEIVEIPVAAYESEPNDDARTASTWAVAALIYGRVGALNDKDKFRIVVDETRAAQKWEIRLDSNSRQERRLCLENARTDVPTHCRSGRGTVALVDLVLPVGEYVVDVRGQSDPGEQYTLSSRITGISEPDAEAEPNDNPDQAVLLGETLRARGRFDGVEQDERDVYHLLVTGTAQLWRIQVVGDGVTDLAYINAAKRREQTMRSDNQRRLRLSNLYLLPGSHYYEVRGTSGEYQLIAVPLGPPPPGLELEPNGDSSQANKLRFGEARVGLLTDSSDEDAFRFSLAAEEHVKLTITPPDDGSIESRINWGRFSVGGQRNPVVGEAFVYDSILSPGDYEMRVFSATPSDSPYTVLLTREDPFAVVIDREPNDSVPFASPVPSSLVVRGIVGEMNDYDWFRLPPITEDTLLEIHSASRYDIRLHDADSNVLSGFNWDSDGQLFSGTLDATAPQPFYFRIGGRGPYELRLDFETGPQSKPVDGLTAELELALDQTEVAAYWHIGQAIDGVMRIANTGDSPLDLALDSHASHYKLEFDLAEEAVALPPGTQQELPVRVVMDADLPTDEYRVTIRARTSTGQQVTANAALSATVDAVPVSPQLIWPMPSSMLGGFNAAALSFGAEILTEDRALSEAQRDLHDGHTVLQDAFRANASQLPITLTVKLAGDDPQSVTGLLLNPQSQGEAVNKLNEFELWLSLDGESYSLALADQLTALPIEQAFPLPEPVTARYAQLKLLSNHAGNTGSIELGEWKIVAAPDAPMAERLNLADPQNGGYVVYNVPQHRQEAEVASVLVADDQAYRFNVDPTSEAEWILGFQHDRAARVTEIEWVEASNTPPETRLEELTVWVSLESPIGPWTALGTWTLAPGTAAITLSEPVWARYLRFALPTGAEQTSAFAPDAIRVWERTVDGDYRSAIGEWGHYTRSAVYEWSEPPAVPEIAADADTNDSREEAETLRAGQPMFGQVQIGEDVDWYRIDVPEDLNAVTLRLTGDPTVRVGVVFEDAGGQPLPAKVEWVSPTEQMVTAIAPPSSTVYFRVEEPPRSVLFLWDNSGSVGQYFDIIYNSLTAFIEGVTPGREVANFLPFGGNMLLPNWGEQPAALQQALNDYDRRHQSSDSEAALLEAAAALAQREGTKAVIILTDGATGSYLDRTELWSAFQAVQPRIFSLHISTSISDGKPANEQDLMQSWADVNGGYYDFLRSQADLEIAFERASVLLRRPAGYTFTPEVIYVEPPGPGTLRLLSGTTDEAASLRREWLTDTTVEIVLDASGSMTEQLDNRTRIDIAKDVLLDLINTTIPEGASFALRVFGNREGNFSCRTDLEVPPQPLNRAAVRDVIQNIVPQFNANTAIGQSLLLIRDDLAGITGRKVVILLTDGQETCDGDPEAAITALREQGIDTQVNIVGLAIDDTSLKAQFEAWAAVGGGSFFDAGSAEELADSLTAVLNVPYRVMDSEGQVVGHGVIDGDPVSLAAGAYTIEVLTQPVVRIEDVLVTGEEALELQIGEQLPD